MRKMLIWVLAISLLISNFTAVVNCEGLKSFGDIKGNWAENEINTLVNKGIIDGCSDGTFKPAGELTRVQFVKMLVMAMGYKLSDGSTFSDISKHWGKKYIETAVKQGVIIPSEAGKSFNPDKVLSRTDMITMMCRALKLKPSTGANPYSDMSKANGYATKSYEEYLIRGIKENGKLLFKPDGITTRAEATVIIIRMIDYKANSAVYKEKMKEKELAAQKYTPVLKRDLEFEAFMQTKEAEQYSGVHRWFNAGEGTIILNDYDYQPDRIGYVDNSKFENINVLTYNLVSELTKYARKYNKYVNAWSNGENVIINFYESKSAGEGIQDRGSFSIYLKSIPDKNNSKQNQYSYVIIEMTALWEYIDENGYAIEKDLIEQPYEEALQACLREIYGEVDSMAIYKHLINEYKLKYEKKFKYTNNTIIDINGIEVINFVDGGINYIKTNIK